ARVPRLGERRPRPGPVRGGGVPEGGAEGPGGGRGRRGDVPVGREARLLGIRGGAEADPVRGPGGPARGRYGGHVHGVDPPLEAGRRAVRAVRAGLLSTPRRLA